jgi:hypothetical protein
MIGVDLIYAPFISLSCYWKPEKDGIFSYFHFPHARSAFFLYIVFWILQKTDFFTVIHCNEEPVIDATGGQDFLRPIKNTLILVTVGAELTQITCPSEAYGGRMSLSRVRFDSSY